MPNPDLDAPESYRKTLLRIGGKNPHGKPMWRVCIAEHCTRKTSGLLHHLPTGELSVFEIDGKGKVHGKTSLGDRVESGVFELPRYPVEGWIIERWFPAAIWGTPETWNAEKGESGERIMAEEFPREGDYWMTNGPFEQIPDIGDLENAVQQWEHEFRNRPTNVEGLFERSIKAARERREKRRQRLIKELEYLRQHELVPVLKSSSLEAQSVRNDLQKMVGDRSHLGAVLNP